jgi:uncharacterized membrane protein YdbT with pleckstrin-like domain
MPDRPDWLSLDDDEAVVWTGRPRTRSILSTVAGSIVGVVAAVAVAAWITTSGVTIGPPGIQRLVPAGIVALAVLWAVTRIGSAYLRIRNTDYVLTSRGLYRKTGVLSETTTRVAIDRIQNTTLSKGLFGNLFDYGDVDVSTAGGSGVELSITDLDDPGELRDLLRKRMKAIKDERAAAGDAGGERAARRDLDAAALGRLVDEARRLRETAEGIEEATR